MERTHGNPLRSMLFEAVLWLFLTPLELFFGWLSPNGIARCARIFYWIACPFMAGMRKVTLANLAVAFPEKTEEERRKIAVDSLRHTICIALEWLHLLHKPYDHERLLTIPDEVRKAFGQLRAASPDGIVMGMTAHLGNWEFFSHINYVTGHPGAVITASFSEPALNKLAGKLRTAEDDTVIIPSKGAAFGMLKAVRNKRDLGVLIDQNVSVSRGGVYMPFFGLDAGTSTLPVSIARRFGMPVLVLGCIRRPDGRYVAEYEPLEKHAMEYADDFDLSCAVLRAYERMIRRHPEQYLWSYRRWRDIPHAADEAAAGKYPFYAKRDSM